MRPQITLTDQIPLLRVHLRPRHRGVTSHLSPLDSSMVRGADTEIQINKGDSPARVVSANRSAPAAAAAPTWSGTEPRREAQARPPAYRSLDLILPAGRIVSTGTTGSRATVASAIAARIHARTRGKQKPGRGDAWAWFHRRPFRALLGAWTEFGRVLAGPSSGSIGN